MGRQTDRQNGDANTPLADSGTLSQQIKTKDIPQKNIISWNRKTSFFETEKHHFKGA